MDRRDRDAIEGLFEKLAEVERQGTARDTEAEAFIRQQIAQQPSAPYYMAQTIVVQEQALQEAEARMRQLEGEAERAAGGLFGGLFGGGAPKRPSRSMSVPRAGSRDRGAQAMGQPGFLAGAAQTAMGVAGGVLLGSAIAGMFGGDEAQASEPAAGESDDGGFDGGDLGGGDF